MKIDGPEQLNLVVLNFLNLPNKTTLKLKPSFLPQIFIYEKFGSILKIGHSD